MSHGYNFKLERKNIVNYSPFCHINELPAKYRAASFLLPIIRYKGKEIPMHPDMFESLALDKGVIVKKIRVYPTSSFRTVFYPEKNICWKVPIKRKITRGIRDLSKKQLERAGVAQKILSKSSCKNFSFLPEKCFSFKDPDYNYIERPMPNDAVFPLFYIISRGFFTRKYRMTIIKNLIYSWMFWAHKGLFLEYHTQNVLVRKNGEIVYRDLSDIKSDRYHKLMPSYYSHLKNRSELASVIFDRAVCGQNLDHFDAYKKFTKKEIKNIRDMISEFSEKFGIVFPRYSLDFEPNVARRIPIRGEITRWRKNTIEENISELKQVFKKIKGNFAVRGSFARGDSDFNDIDVAIYHEENETIDYHKLPKLFKGKKIAYWSIPVKDADRYYEHCLRVSISLVETQIIKLENRKIKKIIERQKDRFYRLRRMKYLLYLLVDEEVMAGIYSGIQDGSYSMSKRRPGSKRTIARIVWAAKTLFPKIKNLGTQQTLDFLCREKIMPEAVRSACSRVLEGLSDKNTAENEWQKDTDGIKRWHQKKFKRLLLSKLAGHIDETLVTLSVLVAGKTATRDDLHKAYEFSQELKFGPEKFILYFALSGNLRTDSNDLVKIFHEIKDDFVYNNIARNLIMNPNFPDTLLPRDLIRKIDPYKRAYEIRIRLKKLFSSRAH